MTIIPGSTFAASSRSSGGRAARASGKLIDHEVAVSCGMLVVTAPVRIVSEMNVREHHFARHRRKKNQQAVLAVVFSDGIVREWLKSWKPPYSVTLTRIGPRMFDAHDNLRASFKHVVDQIARELGIDDGDTEQVTWKYMPQRKSKEYGVEIGIAGA